MWDQKGLDAFSKACGGLGNLTVDHQIGTEKQWACTFLPFVGSASCIEAMLDIEYAKASLTLQSLTLAFSPYLSHSHSPKVSPEFSFYTGPRRFHPVDECVQLGLLAREVGGAAVGALRQRAAARPLGLVRQRRGAAERRGLHGGRQPPARQARREGRLNTLRIRRSGKSHAPDSPDVTLIRPMCHTPCFPRHRPILLLNLTTRASGAERGGSGPASASTPTSPRRLPS